jgi:hypothetical protein
VNPIVFDKAKWHFEGNFPEDLDERQAFVHTGLFLGWIIDNDLFSEEFAEDFAKEIRRFKARKMTGPKVYSVADGVFADDMLNKEGRAFTRAYFDFDKGKYLKDYDKLLAAGLPSTYHVQDSWENYDRLRAQIDKRCGVAAQAVRAPVNPERRLPSTALDGFAGSPRRATLLDVRPQTLGMGAEL